MSDRARHWRGVAGRHLRGRVVLITGASSGIGRALAQAAAEQGARVVLAARREDRLQELAKTLPNAPLALRCDVSQPADLARVVTEITQHLGRLDVAIANAGFGVSGTLDALCVEDYQRQFDTNVFGVIHTLKATLALLVQSQGYAAVVGSANGYLSLPNYSAYCMSKAAVRALCESVRHEWRPMGVSLTHLCPGFIKSDFRSTDSQGVHQPELADPIPSWLAAETLPAARAMLQAVTDRKEELVLPSHGKFAVALATHARGTVSRVVARSGPWIARWSRKEPTRS